MKRNPDLLRSILTQSEAANPTKPIMQLAIDDSVSNEVLTGHIDLLIEGGLIEGKIIDYSLPAFAITRLTGAGHEFLNPIRKSEEKKTDQKPRDGWHHKIIPGIVIGVVLLIVGAAFRYYFPQWFPK